MVNRPELAQLRDIHLPDPIGWWPPAIGWFYLGAIGCLVILGVFYVSIRAILNGRSKRQALRVLESYRQDYVKTRHTSISAARISELLKRVALVYYPREQVASLQGQAWIDFLNQSGRMVSQSPGKVAFLKHAICIHAAWCRPSMADNSFKKATLPGDCDRIQSGWQMDFNSVAGLLIDCPYQLEGQQDLLPLFHLAQRWIKQRRGRCLS